MRSLRLLALPVLLTAALLLPSTTPDASAASWWATNRADMIKRVNAVRASRGLPRFRSSGSLNYSSQRFARWQILRDYFGHLRRIWASGRFRRRGEVIAFRWGRHAGVAATLRAWLRSPGHRRILLSRAYRHVGAGVAGGWFRGRRAVIWTVQTGSYR